MIQNLSVVKIRQALDQLSSPGLPLSVNNNNNIETDRATSLIRSNAVIAQIDFQIYCHSSSSPSPPQQQGQSFQPINLLSLLLPPRSLDEINNWRPKIPPEPNKNKCLLGRVNF